MIKEARGFGNTINEAQENALANLGAKPEDDVQFETVSMYKKKVLGIFGGSKAEVRAFVELPDPKPQKSKNKNNKKKSAEKKKEKPTVKETKEEIKKAEEIPTDTFDDAIEEEKIPSDTPVGTALAYLRTLLVSLGCENLKIKAATRENIVHVIIEGDKLGAIIGRRGETLDALQYLASLAANNGGGHYRISLNIGDYREKREKALVALANKVAGQVIKNGRSRGLEPMNPYERRVIHTAVQQIEGVSSSSVGEGSRRRVVIYPEGGEIRPPKNGNRRGGNGRDRKPSRTVATEPAREPKKDSDIPLYGKIN